LKNLLRGGRNTLAIEGENRPAPVTRNPAGLLCRLEIRFADGAMMRVDSDDAWRASKTVIDGWQGADFDARDWVAPKLLVFMAVRLGAR
jgi:alpha-L-rhamnosidase